MATGISLAVAAITAAAGAVSAYSSAKEQESQNEYQEKLAENESLKAKYEQDIALRQASEEAKEGHENKIKERLETSKIIAKQRAQQAASNALLDTGSYLDVQLDSAEQGEQRALLKEQEGYDKAYQYQLKAQDAGYSSSQFDDKAKAFAQQAEQANPQEKVATSLLGSALKQGSSFNFFSS